MSTQGKPYLAPLTQPWRKPASTDGMYSRGTTPPKILSTKYRLFGSGFSPSSSRSAANSSACSLVSGSKRIDHRVLATATRLLDVAGLDFYRLGQRLPVGH